MVVAYSLDRLSRNVVDGALLDELIEESGAIILYATQSFNDDADGRFTKNIMRAVSQVEPEKTAKKVIENKLTKANNLEFNGGPIPYGFDVVEKQYVINEKEAEAVKIMFNGIIRGLTIPEIIDALTQTGYFTRDKKPFSPQTIHRILRNVKYKGTYLYNEVGGKKSSRRVLRGEFEEVRINNAIPQVIDEKTFDKVQKLLRNKKRKPQKAKKGPYILTGLIKCGCCGCSMHGYASIGGMYKKRYTNYTCRGGQSRNACGLMIKQEFLEKATATLIVKVLEESKKDTRISKKLFTNIKGSLQKEFNSLKSEIVYIERTINNRINALSNSKNDFVSEVITNQIKNDSTIKKLKEERKNELATQLKQIDDVVKKYLGDELKIDVADILNNSDVFRGLAMLIIDEITITKDEVTFSLKDLS